MKMLKQFGIPLIFACGVAWGTATVTATLTLAGKVDQRVYLDDLARRATLDTTIVRELRTIKYLQCRQQPADSYCHPYE